jgi:hypothetical protein
MLIILLGVFVSHNYNYTLTSLCGLNNGVVADKKTTMQSPKESASVSGGFKLCKVVALLAPSVFGPSSGTSFVKNGQIAARCI